MKNLTCTGDVHKNQCKGGDGLKGEAWTVCRFKGGRGLLKKQWSGDYEGVG